MHLHDKQWEYPLNRLIFLQDMDMHRNKTAVAQKVTALFRQGRELPQGPRARSCRNFVVRVHEGME